MTSTVPFQFKTSPAYDTSRVFYARLNSEIYKPSQLFDALNHLLWLPGYFGFNWNALFECLTDFHWIKERDIVLVHDELPKLGNSELRIYLSVLRDAVLDWESDEKHRLEVVFSESDRECVIDFLNT